MRRAAALPRALSRALSAKAPSQQPVQYAAAAADAAAQHVASKIGLADAAMRAAYDALPTSFAPHALAPGARALGALDVARKRLVYRSKQRGWLEVDLLMGSFADAHLGAYGAAELAAYEAILNRETLDLYNIVTGKDACPPELAGAVMDAIKAHVASSPLGKADPAKYAAMKGHFSN